MESQSSTRRDCGKWIQNKKICKEDKESNDKRENNNNCKKNNISTKKEELNQQSHRNQFIFETKFQPNEENKSKSNIDNNTNKETKIKTVNELDDNDFVLWMTHELIRRFPEYKQDVKKTAEHFWNISGIKAEKKKEMEIEEEFYQNMTPPSEQYDSEEGDNDILF